MTFEINVESVFCASSALPELKDIACSRLHGYSYQVSAKLIHIKPLPSSGYLGDVYALQGALDQTLTPLKHRHLNELAYFEKHPPTMENIAIWVFEHYQQQLANMQTPLQLKSIDLSNHMGINLTYYPS